MFYKIRSLINWFKIARKIFLNSISAVIQSILAFKITSISSSRFRTVSISTINRGTANGGKSISL